MNDVTDDHRRALDLSSETDALSQSLRFPWNEVNMAAPRSFVVGLSGVAVVWLHEARLHGPPTLGRPHSSVEALGMAGLTSEGTGGQTPVPRLVLNPTFPALTNMTIYSTRARFVIVASDQVRALSHRQ